MKEDIKLATFQNPTDNSSSIMATIPHRLWVAFADGLIELIADKIAERYVQEHYAEIVKNLDQQAIANLAIADSGKKIAEEIRARPTVIREPGNRTSVTKFSLF